MSTIRGLLVLGLYMAGRGFDGPCQIFVGLALKLAEGALCFSLRSKLAQLALHRG